MVQSAVVGHNKFDVEQCANWNFVNNEEGGGMIGAHESEDASGVAERGRVRESAIDWRSRR